MSFGKENVGKFTIANISYFSEPGIWLGKILASGVRFAKFAKVFPTKILHFMVPYNQIFSLGIYFRIIRGSSGIREYCLIILL